ncbi:Protein Prr14L [Manis pentadactyla]|nr:Protein Prr14L [Manis pentadactyla]
MRRERPGTTTRPGFFCEAGSLQVMVQDSVSTMIPVLCAGIAGAESYGSQERVAAGAALALRGGGGELKRRLDFLESKRYYKAWNRSTGLIRLQEASYSSNIPWCFGAPDPKKELKMTCLGPEGGKCNSDCTKQYLIKLWTWA